MTTNPHTPRRSLIPWYAALLAGSATVLAVVADPAAILDDPLLFGLLLAFVLALDLARIDLFGNGTTTPSSIPTVAIAAIFGVSAAVLGTLVPMVIDLIRRKPPLKVAFDFGSLGLSGAAAAATVLAVPAHGSVAELAVVALAGIAYSAVNNLFVLVVWHLDEGISLRSAFTERLGWKWPYDLACGVMAGLIVLTERELGLFALAVFGAPLVLIWIGEKNQIDNSRKVVDDLRYTNHELAGANTRLREALAENQLLLETTHRTYLSTITSLARTIEAKDPYTGGHTERVADVAAALAADLGFGEEELRAVQVGAIIHDIGKIGIADSILLKPGKLNDEEFAEMRRHPEISSYILDELELPPIVKQMARHHHERFDGSGYPDGLAGESIPLAARVLTVADAFDAMTSDRPYRRAMSESAARAEIDRGAGSQFCPRVAGSLARVLDSGGLREAPDSAFTLPLPQSAPDPA